jgi:hypothetical protein
LLSVIIKDIFAITTSPFYSLLLKEREFKTLLLEKEKGWDEVDLKSIYNLEKFNID